MTMKETREALGWTQTRLARELGISKAFACELEKGRAAMNMRTRLALECLLRRHGLADKHAETAA
jgi:DNA-binding XRE family transcriptional regulator